MTNNLHPALAHARHMDVDRHARQPRVEHPPKPRRAPRARHIAATLRVLRGRA